MNSLKKVLWGLVLIILGTIIFLNRMGYANIDIFFNGWWTLFIIVPSFIGIFNKDGRFLSIIFFIIGILLLLASQDIINFEDVSKIILPLVLIIIGISIIFKGITNNIKIPNVKNETEYYATFSKQNINLTNTFNGCDTNAVFGALTLDLRDTKIKNNSVIKTVSVFGATEIIVPKNTNVLVKSTCLFGGLDNKIKNETDNKNTLYIEVLCLFGGVDIKNEHE